MGDDRGRRSWETVMGYGRVRRSWETVIGDGRGRWSWEKVLGDGHGRRSSAGFINVSTIVVINDCQRWLYKVAVKNAN